MVHFLLISGLHPVGSFSPKAAAIGMPSPNIPLGKLPMTLRALGWIASGKNWRYLTEEALLSCAYTLHLGIRINSVPDHFHRLIFRPVSGYVEPSLVPSASLSGGSRLRRECLRLSRCASSSGLRLCRPEPRWHPGICYPHRTYSGWVGNLGRGGCLRERPIDALCEQARELQAGGHKGA